MKSNAQTGKPTPYISITFIGKSRPLDELCKHTPRSAQAEIICIVLLLKYPDRVEVQTFVKKLIEIQFYLKVMDNRYSQAKA